MNIQEEEDDVRIHMNYLQKEDNPLRVSNKSAESSTIQNLRTMETRNSKPFKAEPECCNKRSKHKTKMIFSEPHKIKVNHRA